MSKSDHQNMIEVGELDKKVYIRVTGAGNFKNSSPFKDFFHLMLDRSCTDFMIDLKHCTAMDSTFMGVIAGMAVLLKDSCDKTLLVINVSNHNLNLLSTLGIDKFLAIETKDKTRPAELSSLEQKRVSKKKLAKNMLDAHAILMNISDENRIKFKDVYDFLERELEDS